MVKRTTLYTESDARDFVRPYTNLVTEVVVEYLMKGDDCDFVLFASNFFTTKKKQIQNLIEKQESSAGGSDEEVVPPVRSSRREAVYGNTIIDEADLNVPVVTHPKTSLQRTGLSSVLRSIVFFKGHGLEEINEVVDAMMPVPVNAGDVVINEGDEGDYFYVIEGGSFVAYTMKDGERVVLQRYDGEGYFGELALLYNVPRACNVAAETAGQLWSLDRNTFQRVIVRKALDKRQLYESLITSVPMLENLSEYEKMNLADALQSENFAEGEMIVEEGDTGDKMYFVAEGRVLVTTTDPQSGAPRILARIGEGGYFGEMALLSKLNRRAASVIAETDVRLASLSGEAFERLLGPCREIMERHMQSYTRYSYHRLKALWRRVLLYLLDTPEVVQAERLLLEVEQST